MGEGKSPYDTQKRNVYERRFDKVVRQLTHVSSGFSVLFSFPIISISWLDFFGCGGSLLRKRAPFCFGSGGTDSISLKTNMSSRPLKLPGYADVQTQLEALVAWQQKTKETTRRIASFDKAKKELNARSKNAAHCKVWLAERERLGRQRTQLSSAVAKSLHLISKPTESPTEFDLNVKIVASQSNQWNEALQEEARALFDVIFVLRDRLSSLQSRDAACRTIEEVKRGVGMALKELANECDSLETEVESMGVVSSSPGDEDITSVAKAQQEEIQASFRDDPAESSESVRAIASAVRESAAAIISKYVEVSHSSSVEARTAPAAVQDTDYRTVKVAAEEYRAACGLLPVTVINELLQERLAAVLPSLSREQIRAALRKVEQDKYRQQSASISLRELKTELEQLSQFGSAAIEAQRQVEEAIREQESNLEQQEKKRNLLHQQLQKLQSERKTQEAEEAAAKLKQQAEEIASQRAEFEKRQRQQEATALLLRNYQQQQAEQRRKEAAEQQQREIQARKDAREKAVASKPRVQERNDALARRMCDERNEAEMEKQAAEAHRERVAAVLARLADRLGVVRSAERAMQSTVASAAPRGCTLLEEASKQQVGGALHGFSDEQVTSDWRFRLQQALAGAGLQQSAYAQMVFKRAARVAPAQQVSK